MKQDWKAILMPFVKKCSRCDDFEEESQSPKKSPAVVWVVLILAAILFVLWTQA